MILKVHDPRGSVGAPTGQLAPALASLSSKTVALFANNKPNADVLLEAVGEQLVERVGVKLLKIEPKNAALPASEEVIEKLSQEVDAALVGSAD